MSPESGTILILDGDGSELKDAAETLTSSNGSKVVYASSLEDARASLNGTPPQIAMVSCVAGPTEAESMLADLGVRPAWVIAGATAEQAKDPDFLRTVMQARFNDILALPISSETLSEAIENGFRRVPGETGGQGKGKVVALYSSKGGAGVSTLTVNLALALNRLEGLKIGVLDVDLQCGVVAPLLNLQPAHTLAKLGDVAIDGDGELREELLSRITTHESGVRVIASPTVLHDGLNISADILGRSIRILRERFDILLVDTPKWVGDRLVAALDEADLILVVTDPQIPSLAKVRESLRLFSRFEYPTEKIELVFNRVEKKGELQPEEAADALNRKVYFALPNEPVVLANAANHGIPPLAGEAKGPFPAAMMEFAAKLRSELGFGAPKPLKKRRGFLFRWKRS